MEKSAILAADDAELRDLTLRLALDRGSLEAIGTVVRLLPDVQHSEECHRRGVVAESNAQTAEPLHLLRRQLLDLFGRGGRLGGELLRGLRRELAQG